MDKMYLGIDIGTSSVKALAVSRERRVSASGKYPAGTSATEHDPKMLLAAVKEAIQGVLSQGVSPEDIGGIGMDGHGPSIVFVDEEGRAVTPIVTWQDRRAEEEMNALRSAIPGFMKDATSYEAKLLWFYRRYPELFTPGHTAMYPKDYVFFCLTGRRIMDHSTASTIAFYDYPKSSWEACEAFFPKDVMPEVIPAYSEGGRCVTPYALECGLKESTPIYPGGIDAFCEIVGAGGFSESIIVDGSGTSSCLSRRVPVVPGVKRHVLPDSALIQCSTNCSGQSYKWLGRLFDKEDLDSLQDKIDTSEPSGIIYLPYLIGERAPIFDGRATGLFFGLTLDTKKEDLLKALFEGVAFSLLHNIETMGEGVQRIRAVGGANSSEKWLQIKANVSGITIEQMAEKDAAALGSALLAALGSGDYDEKSLGELVSINKVIEPEPGAHEKYLKFFEIYKELYPALKEQMHVLSRLKE